MITAILNAGGCASGVRPDPLAAFKAALEASDPRKRGGVAPGSAEEKAAIERFKDFFSVYSPENIKAKIRSTYAEEFYFNDTLKEVHRLAALEEYMLAGAAAVESCTVEYYDVLSKDGDHFFRWLMRIRFKKLQKGRTHESIGISQIRFNPEGRVVFHQDYWDSSAGFFEKVPVLGGMIRWIKKRL